MFGIRQEIKQWKSYIWWVWEIEELTDILGVTLLKMTLMNRGDVDWLYSLINVKRLNVEEEE